MRRQGSSYLPLEGGPYLSLQGEPKGASPIEKFRGGACDRRSLQSIAGPSPRHSENEQEGRERGAIPRFPDPQSIEVQPHLGHPIDLEMEKEGPESMKFISGLWPLTPLGGGKARAKTQGPR